MFLCGSFQTVLCGTESIVLHRLGKLSVTSAATFFIVHMEGLVWLLCLLKADFHSFVFPISLSLALHGRDFPFSLYSDGQSVYPQLLLLDLNLLGSEIAAFSEHLFLY